MQKSKSESAFAEKYRRDGAQSQRKYPSEAAVRYLATKFQITALTQTSPTVLDLGCGSGSNLMMLVKEGFRAIGLDSSALSLGLAQDLCTDWGLKRPAVVAGSFLNIPFLANSIDCIIDIVSLQHLNLEESSLALSEVSRVLKPDAKFFSYRLCDRTSFFSVMQQDPHCIDSVTMANIPASYPLGNNGPTSFWNEDLAAQFYLKSDLTIEEVTYVSRSYKNGHHVDYMEISAIKKA